MGNKKKHKDKIPKYYHTPSTAKIPRIQTDPASFFKANPAWRISNLEMVDPFGWHQIDSSTLESIRDRLKAFESMTWDEILIKAKKQNHQIKRNQICKSAQDRLMELGLADIDEVCSLRIDGEKRVFGILDRGILRLLWWDPQHQICPSHIRHT